MSDETLPRHLSPADSVAWRIEQNPLLRSTIALVIRLDQAPDDAILRERLAAAVQAFPRMRQRVREIPLGVSTPVWADDPNFDMDYHVRVVGAAGERDDRSVLDLAAAQTMQAFDRERPLWEWTTINGLADGGSAVILKVHHSVTDGVGGVRLMAELFDLERRPTHPRALSDIDEEADGDTSALGLLAEGVLHKTGAGLGSVRSIAGKTVGAVRRPLASAETVVRDLASTARLVAPASGPLSPLMRDRSPRNHFETFSLPLADLKAAARRVDGTINDAFMTAVAVGLRKYHEVHGESVDALRVNMPINLRTDDSSRGGNNWAPSRFVVPVKVAGGVDKHMRAMHDVVAAQRAEPALQYAQNIAALMNQLPTALLTQLFTGMLTCLDFAATNVAGTPFPLYLAGARIDSMMAFAPPSGAAVNVSLFTYEGTAGVALNIDPAAVPDPATLRDCLEAGFRAVIHVRPGATTKPRATKPAARSRRVAVPVD